MTLKKKSDILNNPIADVISKIRTDNKLEDSKKIEADGVVDIMTFCTRSDLLDLPGNNLKLFLSQRVILKTFYMGSRGNENVVLNDEEMNWLYEKQQNSAIVKIKRKLDGVVGDHNFNFTELNLACGRRASKTLMASIISSYEAYKLIKMGDPYKFYNLPYDKEIAVINVANSQKQAGRLFADLKTRIRNSPFFKGRVQGKGESSSEIRLYTDQDLKKLKDKNYNIAIEGSIVLVCGHSNPDTLRGYAAICIIFDELQYYDEHPVISGKSFYDALTPSVLDFTEYGDGRLVEISTTGSPSGIFHDIHLQGQSVDPDFNEILGYHLTTWDLNDAYPYNCKFLTLQRKKDPVMFDVEYGARWSVSGFVGRFFAEDKIRRAFRPDLFMINERQSMQDYFMHIDPAATHDNYSIAIVYRQKYTLRTGEKRYKVILAFHQNWKPVPGIGLDIVKLDDEVLAIARKFRPRSITFDTWNSVHSINYLTNKGFYATQLNFSRGSKAVYYQNLLDLMDRDELALYYDDQLMGELMNLKFRPTSRGISLFPDTSATVSSDDLIDCLAGASWMAVGRRLKETYPSGTLMRLGFV